MKWRGRRESENVTDMRGRRRMPGGVKIGGGLGGIVILLLAYFLLGPQQAQQVAQQMQNAQGNVAQPQAPAGPEAEDEAYRFVKVVLADTEDAWGEIFQRSGGQYKKPELVVYSDEIDIPGLGTASAAMGPFYYPSNQKIYIDLNFFRELHALGGKGDFAQAYVIYHEVGHHVQNLLGTSGDVHRKQQRVSKEASNDLSVRLELQADFYAGVCARYIQERKDVLDPGDFQEALRCARSIGDDALQRRSRGVVTPHTFTHGSSDQRERWFRKGYETGDLSQGDTFGAARL